VAELQALVTSELPDHNLALNLRQVKLVDRDAVQFVAQSESQGATRNCSAHILEWISQERNGMRNTTAEEQQL
jgi:hypothetical protein